MGLFAVPALLVICPSCSPIVQVWSASGCQRRCNASCPCCQGSLCKIQHASESCYQPGVLRLRKAPACAQGYGGGSAVGGGQTGGDQFTSDEPSRKQQGQDAAYGGDQTNLDAGADTNFGVSAIQCYRLWTLYSMDLQCTVAGKLGTAAKCVLFREVV